MSIDDEDLVIFDKDKVGPMEIIKIRSNRIRDDMKKPVIILFLLASVRNAIYDSLCINQ